MSTNLEINLEERVLRITLNRAEKRNALSFALCRELSAAFESADGRGAGAVLLTANGNVFCAGMDLSEALDEGAAEEAAAAHDLLFTAGARLTVPIVAAVNGPALGGGLGLLANAHIAVAAQGATFGLTEIRIGMWPFLIWRAVARVLGERRALELALTGRTFGTTEALAWGLVDFVVPPFELEDRAWQIASGVAASSRDTIRRGMAFVHAARDLDWDDAGRLAMEARGPVFNGVDFREGIAAFRERRKPKWPSLEP